MSTKGFHRCHKITAKWEGGNVDHPDDPGGRTGFGVTQAVYNAYRRKKGLPIQDVYKSTEAERKDIYVTNYWKPARCDDLPPGVDLCVYDAAVNSGVSRGVKLLQGALRARGAQINVDGIVGDLTLQAVRRDPDPDMLVAEFCRRRQAFFQSLPQWRTFGRGWSARNAGIKRQGQLWAMGSVGTYLEVPVVPDAGAKAPDAPIKAPTTASAEESGAATGGAIIAKNVVEQSLGERLAGWINTLTGYEHMSTWISYVVTSLIVLMAGYTIYAAWKSYRANKVLNADAGADVDDRALQVEQIKDDTDVMAEPAVVDTVHHQDGDGAAVRLAEQEGRYRGGAAPRGQRDRKAARKRSPAPRKRKRAKAA